jgi:hypothetical protein
VELKVAQYGVTRARLAEIAGTGDGWDVLHLSGHGGPGSFLLEHADDAPVRAPVGSVAARDRDKVRRVLHVVQGHPKLMELADEAAAEQAAAGLGLDAFFRGGDSTLDPGQFLAALTGWTVRALNVLTPAARLMAQFVACLEDDDQRPDVIEATWAELWRQVDRPGDPPPPAPGRVAAAREKHHGLF